MLQTTHACKVTHSFPEDPTMGIYRTLIMVDESSNTVHVGTPLACPQAINHVEVHAVVQLLLGRIVTVEAQSIDTVDTVSDGCPRCWKTYELT